MVGIVFQRPGRPCGGWSARSPSASLRPSRMFGRRHVGRSRDQTLERDDVAALPFDRENLALAYVRGRANNARPHVAGAHSAQPVLVILDCPCDVGALPAEHIEHRRVEREDPILGRAPDSGVELRSGDGTVELVERRGTGQALPDRRGFALNVGAQGGALAGLTWRALDLDGARLALEQQLVPTRGGASFGAPKSSRSRRTIALDPETVDILRRHRATQLLERDFAGPAYEDRDLVFADALGRGDPRAAAHRAVREAPQGGGHPDRQPARAAPHGRQRWRSRRAFPCTSWRPGSATTRSRS